MRLFIAVLMIATLGFLGCSSGETDSASDGTVVAPNRGIIGQPMTPEEVRQRQLDQIDDVGYYDVIVTDVDGWDIRLWQVRHRANRDVVTYRGTLAYYSGANYYEGTAAGVWDYENNIFSCTCLDSSWNGGHINYVMPFQGYTDEGEVSLKGPYYYLENPNRVNRIWAWVLEGNGGFPYINPDPDPDAVSADPKTKEEMVEFLSRARGELVPNDPPPGTSANPKSEIMVE